MFTLKEVQSELLNRYNQDIDLDVLEECVHIWDIEATELTENNKVFNESSLRKLYRGLKLKLSGYNEHIINEILSKTSYSKEEAKKYQQPEQQKNISDEETVKKLSTQTNPNKKNNNVINILSKETVENSSNKKETPQNNNQNFGKLVNQLSDSVAKKVSSELIEFLKNSELTNNIEDMGSLKRDNEILSKQVKELLKVNTVLEDRLFKMELNNSSYKQIWKNFYFKTFEN